MDISDAEYEQVVSACAMLREHFDTVQILVSRYDDSPNGGTGKVTYGSGDWYARYGLARSFVLKCDEEEKKAVQEREG